MDRKDDPTLPHGYLVSRIMLLIGFCFGAAAGISAAVGWWLAAILASAPAVLMFGTFWLAERRYLTEISNGERSPRGERVP